MQRRAAAMYLAFFVIVGAAAYGLIVTTSAPAVSVDGEARSNGSEVALGDRTYQLSVQGGSGELAWTNESAVITNELENGSEVPVTDVQWEGQTARQEATFEAGETVPFNGSEYEVGVENGTLTLTDPDDAADNATFAAGDTFQFQGFEATVAAVGDGTATVVWGSPYVLDIAAENVTDPTEATFVEQRNLTRLAANDPALYDEINEVNGTRVVTFRANETNVPVETYFDDPERHTIEEGGSLQYQGNESDVSQVTNETVELRRGTTATETISLSEGENATVAGEQYFAHFPDDSSVMILETDERYGDYRASENRVEGYNDRLVGLWGVAELSFLAAIVLLATAFLPVKG